MGISRIRIIWIQGEPFGDAENGSTVEIIFPFIGPRKRGKYFGSNVSEVKLYLCFIKQ